jgi:hypothetical protein
MAIAARRLRLISNFNRKSWLGFSFSQVIVSSKTTDLALALALAGAFLSTRKGLETALRSNGGHAKWGMGFSTFKISVRFVESWPLASRKRRSVGH